MQEDDDWMQPGVDEPPDGHRADIHNAVYPLSEIS
jgi:hypothetical protein